MDTQMFEEIEALKPKGISMSSFLVQLIEKGKMKPATVHEERATREIDLNAAVHTRQYGEVTTPSEAELNTFRLSQGLTTFNEIIKKHAIELKEKYG